MPAWAIGAILVAFLGVNVISFRTLGRSARTRTALGRRRSSSPTRWSCFSSRARTTATPTPPTGRSSCCPVIEGAIRFQMRRRDRELARARGRIRRLDTGAVARPVGRDRRRSGSRSCSSSRSRAASSPSTSSPRSRRTAAAGDDAEQRGSLLRAAALGGRKSTSLDVDEILDVLRDTVAEMGFAEPQVFELIGEAPAAAGAPGPARPRSSSPSRRTSSCSRRPTTRARRALRSCGRPTTSTRVGGSGSGTPPRGSAGSGTRDCSRCRWRRSTPARSCWSRAGARPGCRRSRRPRASSCSRRRPAPRCATRRCTSSCKR